MNCLTVDVQTGVVGGQSKVDGALGGGIQQVR
jgi:hypothetical protein